ncbi:MAG: NFACT family protein, partial [Treponemataceae bacterium]|nr:NFACT family protein [Treponemataceae bacterium]
MSLNCEEIEIILDELNLEGSFIQQIVQPGFDSLALYTYKEGRSKTVFISLANGACRINETRKKVPKNEKPLRFMEFMKSRIKGCRIDSCEQIGKERIIRFELSHCIDDSVEHFLMFVRLWSGSANIIVTDENLKILDVFYRRPNKGEVGGKVFVLPEIREQTRTFVARTFDEASSNESADESCADGADAASESSADGADAADNENLANKDGRALSYNEKVELYYSENAESLSRKALLEQAERYFSEHRSKIQGALSKLQDKRASFLKSDELKHFGDLILTYGYQIDGESEWLECEDYESGENVRIKIDPKKSVQENASKYYEQYKK